MYEELRREIGLLPTPSTADRREIKWLEPEHVLGVSRTFEGRIELFLVGGQLTVAGHQLRALLEYGEWWSVTSQIVSFNATRLTLPQAAHFEQLGALICTELLHHGVVRDAQVALTLTEPLIVATLQRLRLSDASFIGLMGELIFLDAACRRVPDQALEMIVLGWDGWRPSRRDFVLNALGVEIKTTLGSSSRHHISGLHQIECRDDELSAGLEADLRLVSIGLVEVASDENSVSLSEVVDSLLDRILSADRADLADLLETRIREYGADSGFGYQHSSMHSEPTFNRRFSLAFVRSYDMTDSRVAVPHRSDMRSFEYLDVESLSFVLQLPDQIRGALNPVVGLNKTVDVVLSHL